MKNYTIAWISTVYTDYIAAQAFLDEQHPALLSPRKRFDYTLGRIGESNVVLLLSQIGQRDGMSLEELMTEEMLHDFPNICIGLMVGTGGRAPSKKHDIRLGDIVVSTPRNGEGGVLQYDFDKTIQTESFQSTGYLTQSYVCCASIRRTKSQYEKKGHNLDDKVRKTLEKNPRLQKRYQRPDLVSDRLYCSHIIHPQDNGSPCALSCGDDPSCLVVRPQRLEHDENPVIHYGFIASAHQLMNNGSIRDKLSEQMDVLCFETEAAGLKSHYPFLVIRGICGYADSHNNGDWEGYAAMLAAAYAKDLLSPIPAGLVGRQVGIIDIVNRDNSTRGIEFSGPKIGRVTDKCGKIFSLSKAFPRVRGVTDPADSAFFVSSNIRGRPPVSIKGPKQGSTS